MQTSQVKRFLDIVNDLDIKNFEMFDDIGTRYYNNETGFILLSESTDEVIHVRKALHMEEHSGSLVQVNDTADIRRCIVHGSKEVIKKFIDKYGLSLTDDQVKILLINDVTNKEVMPITGDYHNIFHKLSKESYDALTPDEKAKYDAAIEEEKKRYDLPTGTAAQITY